MRKQKQDRRLPPLSDFRIRRLRARIPLDVLAVRAGIPSASLSRFERDEHPLTEAQLHQLEKALAEASRPANAE